jgi:hypothetical protein
MYFNIFGGSALLHILVAHPKVVAAFGLVATVSMLASPMGYGGYPGATHYAHQLEEYAIMSGELDPATIEAARRASTTRAGMSREVVQQAVSQTLASCHQHCAGLTTARVLADPRLLSQVLYLHELNLIAAARAHAAGDDRRATTTGAARGSK